MAQPPFGYETKVPIEPEGTLVAIFNYPGDPSQLA